MRDGAFLHDDATEGLGQKEVWAIHEDEDHGLWLGTRNDGLYRWKYGKLTHYTTFQGLASNSIYQILEDVKNNLWMSGPNGISMLKRHELDLVADHPVEQLSLRFYALSDEVENAQIYGGRQLSGCLGSRGDVWFPSNRGPIHIVRDGISPLPLPSVVINDVSIDGRSIAADRSIIMQPGQSRLDISFAPICLHSQNGIRFRYKLDGFDQKWSDASTRRDAIYMNLPQGKYTFRVAAYETSDPRWGAIASLAVVQKPHFYRTWWFGAFCAGVIVAAVLGIYRIRLWQIKMRFEAVLDERARLAREMHDTVIQGCTSISALLEAISSQDQSADQVTNDLVETARNEVRVTTNEARQAVWNLRRGDAAENPLGPALQGMAKQISKESGIPIVFDASGKPFVLNQFATYELMMMVREAVHNAVFHGQPAKIEVKVNFAKDHLMLEVRDDGTGFDPFAIPSDGAHHYGLLGMRERAQALGGTFNLDTAIGKGTHLRIQIPRRGSAAQNVLRSA